MAPDYWLFDATTAYHISENFTIRLNVYNLADEEVHRPRWRRALSSRSRALCDPYSQRYLLDAVHANRRPKCFERGAGFGMPEAAGLSPLGGWEGRLRVTNLQKAKDNAQIPEGHPVARQVGETILAALSGDSAASCELRFRQTCLPASVQ